LYYLNIYLDNNFWDN